MQLLHRLHGAKVAVPLLLADDESEAGAVDVAALDGRADVLAERRVGQVALEAQPALLVGEPQGAGAGAPEHLAGVVIEQAAHVGAHDLREGAGGDRSRKPPRSSEVAP